MKRQSCSSRPSSRFAGCFWNVRNGPELALALDDAEHGGGLRARGRARPRGRRRNVEAEILHVCSFEHPFPFLPARDRVANARLLTRHRRDLPAAGRARAGRTARGSAPTRVRRRPIGTTETPRSSSRQVAPRGALPALRGASRVRLAPTPARSSARRKVPSSPTSQRPATFRSSPRGPNRSR